MGLFVSFFFQYSYTDMPVQYHYCLQTCSGKIIIPLIVYIFKCLHTAPLTCHRYWQNLADFDWVWLWCIFCHFWTTLQISIFLHQVHCSYVIKNLTDFCLFSTMEIEFTFYASAWPCPGYSLYKETWIMLVS